MQVITRQEREELALHYYTHIFDFAQDFLPHLLKVKTPEFHLELYKLLRTESLLAIQAPRGFAKSTVAGKVFTIWAGLFRHLGDISIISASEDFVVREITTSIRHEFTSNKRILKFFGEQYNPEQWSASYFVLKNGVAYEGLGINGQLRGGRRGIIILDDLEDNDSVASEEQRNKIQQKVHKEIIPKLLPESTCVLIGTNIHPLCYLNQIIETPNNGWTKRVYRAYKDDGKGLGTEATGNELWADWMNHEKLQQRKATIGSSAFSSEYLNNPQGDESNPIKPEHIRYWTELPTDLTYYISLDPAYVDEQKSDYKVAVVIGVDRHNNRYLVEYVRTHNPVGEYMDACINLYLKYKSKCNKFGIPSGREIDFYKSIVSKAQLRNVFLPDVEIKYVMRDPTTNQSWRNKQQRIIRTLQPHFEQGKYFIHETHVEARDEILTFKSGTIHDDVVDAMSGCEQLIEPFFNHEDIDKASRDYYNETEEEPIDYGTTGYGD